MASPPPPGVSRDDFRPPDLPERSAATPRRVQRIERRRRRWIPVAAGGAAVVVIGVAVGLGIGGGDGDGDVSTSGTTAPTSVTTTEAAAETSTTAATTSAPAESTTTAAPDGHANQVIAESEANLRMGPTSNADLVSTIAPGARVTVDCWADGQQVTLAANGEASETWALLSSPEQAWLSVTLLEDELGSMVPECSTGSSALDQFPSVG